MTWKPGQSGNMRGRPPKERTLTFALVQALEFQTLYQGLDGPHLLPRKDILAALVAEAVTTMQVTLPPDAQGTVRRQPVGVDAWLKLVQLVYSQVDGPPVPERTTADDDLDAVLDALTDLPALPAPASDLSPAD